MNCCLAKPRPCSRPPRRVHIGDRPFQVKQMAWRSGSGSGRCFHWNEDWDSWNGEDYCPGGGFLPPPPPPCFPPRPDGEPEIEKNAAPADADVALAQDFMPDPAGPLPFPGFLPRPGWRRCPDCNLRIKVRRLDACGRAVSGVVMGLFEAGRLIRTVTTNARGQGTFGRLHPGMYEVRELEAPSGVAEDTTRYAVFLDRSCNSATVVFRTGKCAAECPDLGRWWPENPYHA